VDSLDPYSEGICLRVRPKGKSWKKMQMLSGGEKTLSSLSLILAIHKYRPQPVFVLDEIDAALDLHNVAIVARYLRQCNNAQFLVISHRE
jgi:structural maintenance of chromosome 4